MIALGILLIILWVGSLFIAGAAIGEFMARHVNPKWLAFVLMVVTLFGLFWAKDLLHKLIT